LLALASAQPIAAKNALGERVVISLHLPTHIHYSLTARQAQTTLPIGHTELPKTFKHRVFSTLTGSK
jgi:hypothetical protein